MGLFKSKVKKTKTSEQKPHPLTTKWAETVMPYTTQYLEERLSPWLLGEPEERWPSRGEDIWKYATQLPEYMGEMKEYAQGISPTDYSQGYIGALQENLGEALDRAITQARSRAAAGGILYGTPTEDIVSEAIQPILRQHEVELARAATLAPEIQLRAEQLRQQALLPYYQYRMEYPARMADVARTLMAIEKLPEEQRREMFLNLMRVFATLSPIGTGYTPYRTASPFDRMLQVATVVGDIMNGGGGK